MTNNYPNYNYRAPQPQVQGNVYLINSPNELDALPAAPGYTAGIILQENLLILRTFQNGIPITSTYDLVYREKDGKSEITQIKEEIEIIKNLLTNKGGLKDYV